MCEITVWEQMGMLYICLYNYTVYIVPKREATKRSLCFLLELSTSCLLQGCIKVLSLYYNRRLARSTLLLIPLFGIHYTVFAFSPENVSKRERLVFELGLGSFQVIIQ